MKFVADDSSFKATQQWAMLGHGERRVPGQRLRTVYFDTDTRDLWRQMFLRVRARRNRYTMTLKWNGKFPGGAFERGEIEVPMRTPEPDPGLLGEQIAAQIMSVTGGRPLQPCFATEIRRIAHRVRVEASEIEVAFDSGFIVAGEPAIPGARDRAGTEIRRSRRPVPAWPLARGRPSQ